LRVVAPGDALEEPAAAGADDEQVGVAAIREVTQAVARRARGHGEQDRLDPGCDASGLQELERRSRLGTSCFLSQRDRVGVDMRERKLPSPFEELRREGERVAPARAAVDSDDDALKHLATEPSHGACRRSADRASPTYRKPNVSR
jgi:hypothetical protein